MRQTSDTDGDLATSPPMADQQPHEVIWTLTNALVVSRCLHVAAELGLADDVRDEPVTARELASRCGADADALDRVLRLLAAHGVFAREGGGFRHTPASELLRSDHPMSMRAFARMMGLPVVAATFGQLEHSVRTGSSAVETIEPDGFWAYLQDHPDEAQIFGQAMTAKAAADIAAILDAYDFSHFDTIADIGGGRGHLLRAVLDTVPNAEGVLFDLPSVIDALDFEHPRLRAQAGDFFVDPLPAAGAYVLMEVLHDWPDAEALTILSAIRCAAAPGAAVLIIENVLTDEKPDPRGQTLDLIMLAVTGGKERTVTELNDLFTRAGLSDGTVLETTGPLRIVEATTVQ
jgi:C-methyltransferase